MVINDCDNPVQSSIAWYTNCPFRITIVPAHVMRPSSNSVLRKCVYLSSLAEENSEVYEEPMIAWA